MINKKNSLFLILLAAAALFLSGLSAFSFSWWPQQTNLTQPDIKTTRLTQQSGSDEIEAIKKDLEQTDLDGLDAELAKIEAELNQP